MLNAIIAALAIFFGTKLVSWMLGPTGLGRMVKFGGYGLAALVVLGAGFGGGSSEEAQKERAEANVQSYQAPSAPSPYVVPKNPAQP